MFRHNIKQIIVFVGLSLLFGVSVGKTTPRCIIFIEFYTFTDYGFFENFLPVHILPYWIDYNLAWFLELKYYASRLLTFIPVINHVESFATIESCYTLNLFLTCDLFPSYLH